MSYCYCSAHQDCEVGTLSGCKMCSNAEIARLRALIESQAATIEGVRASVRKYLALWKLDEKDYNDQHTAWNEMIEKLEAFAPPYVEPEKAEPCFKDMAGWCSTHTRDSSECEPEKDGEKPCICVGDDDFNHLQGCPSFENPKQGERPCVRGVMLPVCQTHGGVYPEHWPTCRNSRDEKGEGK